MYLGYLTLSPCPFRHRIDKSLLSEGDSANYPSQCNETLWNEARASLIRDTYYWLQTEGMFSLCEEYLDQVALNGFDLRLYLAVYDTHECSPYFKPYVWPKCEHEWVDNPTHKTVYGDDILGVYCEKCGELGWLFDGKVTTKKEGYAAIGAVV